MHLCSKPQKVVNQLTKEWCYEPRLFATNGTNLQWFNKKFATEELANLYIYINKNIIISSYF